MSLVTILIIVLIVAIFAGGPWTGWHSYGYAPSGLIGLVLVIILIMILMGRI